MSAPDKLLTNPIRLAIVAYLNQIAGGDFAALQAVTEASKGNLSIQLKNYNKPITLKFKSLLKATIRTPNAP